ncbi:MAG: TatD family hydrolase [Lachnospiraceae bacterium]|nr:TatD family hydrolase [Lachnospiraceae bacterium]
MIFDTHAHYDDSAFDEDRDALLTSLYEQGIGAVVNVGADMESSDRTVKLTEQYPFIYGAVGVHPDGVGEMNEEKLSRLREYLALPKIVAVGEIGLDYYWDKENHALQQEWFVRQFRLAAELDRPVIIHSREAAADTLDIVKTEFRPGMHVVMHCYSYSLEQAREYLKMGLYFGIGGVLTFKNARKLQEVLEELPMERILLETDCPYLAPVPFRGKRNDSGKLNYMVRRISELKGIPEEEVIRVTEENARRFYKIGEETDV